jgi:hypothetical protein
VPIPAINAALTRPEVGTTTPLGGGSLLGIANTNAGVMTIRKAIALTNN